MGFDFGMGKRKWFGMGMFHVKQLVGGVNDVNILTENENVIDKSTYI